jgi:two-component system, NarL family, nitrate/nitrite response regulator NarL
MVATPIRVVVADDHAIFRSALIGTLNAQKDMVVVGQGETADEAVSLVVHLGPDLVLLDLNMPGNGIDAAAAISRLCPAARSVIMTAQADEEAIETARRVGAHSYILKGISARDLVRLLRLICQDGRVWPSVRDGEWSLVVT